MHSEGQAIQLKTNVTKHLADILTPVSIYLKVRDHFTQAALLESNDFSSAEDCFSYIGLESIAEFKVQNNVTNQNESLLWTLRSLH